MDFYDEDDDEKLFSSSLPNTANGNTLYSSFGDEVGDGYDGGGQHSLAHELAAALMPEPSHGSRMLAEEFGLEFDEGAEGIEDSKPDEINRASPTEHVPQPYLNIPGTSIEPNTLRTPKSDHGDVTRDGSPRVPEISLDALAVLSENLRSIDVFLSRLKAMDADATSQHNLRQPSIENSTSELIKQTFDVLREREGQVKRMEEVTRELRKAVGVQYSLPELEVVEGWIPGSEEREADYGVGPSWSTNGTLEGISEDLEENPDDDNDTTFFSSSNHQSPRFSEQRGFASVRSALTALSGMRATDRSLVNSLAAISDQAQMNAAANADAGRKLRSLRNRLGDWRAEWENAERSKLYIHEWEKGDWGDQIHVTDNTPSLSSTTSSCTASPTPGTPARPSTSSRRVTARSLVEGELEAFGKLLDVADQQRLSIINSCSINVLPY